MAAQKTNRVPQRSTIRCTVGTFRKARFTALVSATRILSAVDSSRTVRRISISVANESRFEEALLLNTVALKTQRPALTSERRSCRIVLIPRQPFREAEKLHESGVGYIPSAV